MNQRALEAGARERCERLRKLAHDAPLNPYRLDADGHRWVEQQSYAWARASRDWMKASDCAMLSAATTGENYADS